MTRKQRLYLRRTIKTIIAFMPFIIGISFVLLVALFGEVCSGRFEGDTQGTCVKIINL